MKIIALIPARGGSKGIARKNLYILSSKPLIAYTLLAALNSSCIDEVWVSSEDDEIISYCAAFDKRINILRRPNIYATDNATAMDVVSHYIDANMVNQEYYIIYLQPTSPLRTALHIDEAVEVLHKTKSYSLVSVEKMKKSPYQTFTIDEKGLLKSVFDQRISNMRRQDLPPTYMPNGAIYIFKVSEYLLNNGFPSNGSVPYVMNETDSIDIDYIEDIKIAEDAIKQNTVSTELALRRI